MLLCALPDMPPPLPSLPSQLVWKSENFLKGAERLRTQWALWAPFLPSPPEYIHTPFAHCAVLFRIGLRCKSGMTSN